MTSDYIPPTRNAVCWDNSTTPSPKTCREKKTLVSTVESYHLLVMTLCGFMKGEEQSLCHSVCKMGKKDEEAITPGKLQPKWGIKLRGHGDVGEIPPSWKVKNNIRFQIHGFQIIWVSTEKSAGVGVKYLHSQSSLIAFHFIWTVFH